jgi:hypothetical protein
MAYKEIGEVDIRGENISRAVKGFMLKKFKLRQILKVDSSNKLTETYFSESNTILAAGGNRNIQGVARGALPPELHPSWQKESADHIKFMGQSTIYYEDVLLDAIPVQARTLIRVAEAIVNAEDTYIYAQLTGATSTSGVVAAAATWNNVSESSRDPLGDCVIGIAAMGSNNYDARANGFLLLNETDYGSLLRNPKVYDNESFKVEKVVKNGLVAVFQSLKIIVTDSVTATEAMIVVGQRAATWKSAAAMQTVAIVNPGITTKIRSWEMGQIQITDPQGLYTITGTA